MKLALTLASMAVIHWGIMSSGDPQGFYGSMFVFYAMMVLDYNNPDSSYRKKYKKIVTFLYGASAFFSFIGVIKIFAIAKVDGKYYVSLDKIMQLGELTLVNVNVLFMIMYSVILVVSGVELSFNVKEKTNLQEVGAK
ncbi:hypothetical protein [Viridibacillus arvi]|uniref:hypothetical protein n=1 Tax=Viridibacillus arvi TaxID=263475 RepID=UPI0034CFD539